MATIKTKPMKLPAAPKPMQPAKVAKPAPMDKPKAMGKAGKVKC